MPEPQTNIKTRTYENAHNGTIQSNIHSLKEECICINMYTSRINNFQLIDESLKNRTDVF